MEITLNIKNETDKKNSFPFTQAKQEDEHTCDVHNNTSKRKEYSELSDVIQDVVIAGSHSTSIVLHWVVLFLVMYPDEQEKVVT